MSGVCLALFREGGWNPCFFRPFNDWEVNCVERFLACLHGKRACWDAEDSFLWSMTKNDKFTIKSLYITLEPNNWGLFQ